MKINELSREAVLRRLATSGQGLSDEEAANRKREFGPNEILAVRKTPLSLKLLRQFTHFLAILLWIAAVLALVSDTLHPGEGMRNLGFAIIAVILVNAVFTFIQEYRAERSVEALRRLLPFQVRVLRDGSERRLPAAEIVPGDVIRIAEGDRAPADCRLIETSFLVVNNAALTGESEPAPLDTTPCAGELIGSPNILFAGATVISGSGTAAVFATGMHTEVGRIALLSSGVEETLSPLQKEIVRVTRIIAFIAACTGVFFFFVGNLLGRNFWENFLFCIGVIVALVPEGLLPTVTLALAMGSQRMAKKKALIKSLPAVETLGAVTVICTDKTGTLTQNRLETLDVWTWEGSVAPHDLTSNAHSLLLEAALLCNNAKYKDGAEHGDPTEAAILRTARQILGEVPSERIYEIPFDSDRKRMTTINRIGNGNFTFTKGAPEIIVGLCRTAAAKGMPVTLGLPERNRILEAGHAMMDRGLRVLALAYKNSDDNPRLSPGDSPGAASLALVETDLTFLGLMGLEDPPRPEVPDAVRRCREAGIRLIMLTGDSSRTALAIARQIGMAHASAVVIEGEEFATMNDASLRKALTVPEVIFSRMAPKHKMRVVTILQEEGERVAVTGDGVNDAPALRKADIGISMGIAGTDVAKEAADMILLDDNFATIINAVEEGRAVYENIRKFISYIFSSNIPEVVPYLASVLLRIPLPLTVIQILAVDLGTDMLPALGLGAEKPTPDLMRRPPRGRHEHLLNVRLLARAYLFLGPIEAAAGLFGFFYVLSAGGWQWGEPLAATAPLYLQATTACLTAIVVTQVANVFACRTFRESALTLGLFSNRLIIAGVCFELMLQLFIVYHPLGNRIFGTYPLAGAVWLSLVPFAAALFLAEEGRKNLLRRSSG